MRKVKFRYFDRHEKKWVYSDDPNRSMSTFWEDESVDAEKGTTTEYTGLRDKNGTEIYEGDVIRWHDIVTSDYSVTFTDGVFCLDDRPSENFYHHREEIGEKWEVIGNIYEVEK